MINSMKIIEIVQLKLQGLSNSKAAARLDLSRNTVQKYWSKYRTLVRDLEQAAAPEEIRQAQEALNAFLNEAPRPKTSVRPRRKYTDEIDAFIDEKLEIEKQRQADGCAAKHPVNARTIWRALKAAGHDISYNTVNDAVKVKREKTLKEGFIHQNYEFGDTFEFDFGFVPLLIDGKKKECVLAVFAAPASGYYQAYLYQNAKVEVTVDAHVRFFNDVGGAFKRGLYDNDSTVVKTFSAASATKEFTSSMLAVAGYYHYTIDTCHVRTPQEKGTVEKAVEVIREAAFGLEYRFESFEQAARALRQAVDLHNQSSLIEQERKHLRKFKGQYENARTQDYKVDGYATVCIDYTHYSVPDEYIGRKVRVRLYPNDLYILSQQGEQLAHHPRVYGASARNKKWQMDWKHHLRILKEKPGGLANSPQLAACPALKKIFIFHFKENAPEFLVFLESIRDLDPDEKELEAAALKFLRKKGEKPVQSEDAIERRTSKSISEIESLFIGGNHGTY